MRNISEQLVTRPLVSVLMNCYNGEPYLKEAVDSVLAQSYENWELIFWDNQSTDRSAALFKSYSDQRLKYFYAPEHSNLSEARAIAFQHLTGEYVAVLDTDDLWRPQKLERQIDFFQSKTGRASHLVLLGTGYRLINEQGEPITQLIPPTTIEEVRVAMAEANPFGNSSVMFHRESARCQGGYDQRFVFANDFDLWLKLFTIGNGAVLPECLTDIRIVSTSLTRTPQYKLAFAHETLALYQRAAQQFSDDPRARQASQKAFARSGFAYGQALLQAGHRLEGWRWLAWALGHNPVVFFKEWLRPWKQFLQRRWPKAQS
ncbi:MAG: glycosyltransferase family A protein [Cyanobacteria bacterium P01_D01_bin.128]